MKEKKITEGILVLNNLNVAYQIIKNTDTPRFNILYIHGLSGGKHTLNNLALKVKDCNFYSIDYPAHQKTSLNTLEELTMPSYGNLTKEFIRKMDLKNIVALGHSLGGGTLSELYSIKEIEGFVLISVISSAILELLSNPIFDAFKVLLEKTKKLYNIVDLKIPLDKLKVLVKKDLKMDILSPQQYIIPLYKALGYLKRADDNYKKIQKPCLVIHGDSDKVVPCKTTVKVLKRNLADATYKIIKGCDHVPYVSHEKETIEALEEFLNTLKK